MAGIQICDDCKTCKNTACVDLDKLNKVMAESAEGAKK